MNMTYICFVLPLHYYPQVQMKIFLAITFSTLLLQVLIDLCLPPCSKIDLQLNGVSPELIKRLIPEHVRQQAGLGFPQPVRT